jgi:hypothetical protein
MSVDIDGHEWIRILFIECEKDVHQTIEKYAD